jgi:hypothetical protein
MPKIQLVAYEIDTHHTTTLDEISEKAYFTHQANELRDRLCEVTDQLDPTALTIFLAPAFYFKYGHGKPYSRTAFYHVRLYMAMLSAEFPDVLWVPGTVWWSEPAKPDEDMVIVHNTALVYFQGQLIRTWQKERLSTLECLNAGPEVWDRWEVEHARIVDETQEPSFLVCHERDPLHVGIEICLDHRTLDQKEAPSYGALRTFYAKHYPHGRGVDIHLHTTVGVPIHPENVVARSGGLFLRCDGGASPTTRSSCVVVDRSENTPQALHDWAPILTLHKPTQIGTTLNNCVAVYPPVTVP